MPLLLIQPSRTQSSSWCNSCVLVACVHCAGLAVFRIFSSESCALNESDRRNPKSVRFSSLTRRPSLLSGSSFVTLSPTPKTPSPSPPPHHVDQLKDCSLAIIVSSFLTQTENDDNRYWLPVSAERHLSFITLNGFLLFPFFSSFIFVYFLIHLFFICY